MIDEEVLLECIYEEELRLGNIFILQDILKDLSTAKELLEREYKNTKTLVCEHCETPIKYDVHDCVYFHTIKKWGNDNFYSKDFNNGYWCNKNKIHSATPKRKESNERTNAGKDKTNSKERK